ncbi:MAG: phage tail assembly protein [Burkholderiales bacterium]|nr:MAG: phage tail assembly protein [Burkholderiales bacterium]
MSTKVPLKKPVKAHGEEVSFLTLRDPGTKDVMELGLPTLIIPSADGKSVGIEIRQGVIGRYISRLAQIPMSSVEALHLSDFSACTAVVMGFFETSDGEATTEPSNA